MDLEKPSEQQRKMYFNPHKQINPMDFGQNGQNPNGGQPSVMLHNSIRSKAPGGKKEIDVYKLNH